MMEAVEGVNFAPFNGGGGAEWRTMRPMHIHIAVSYASMVRATCLSVFPKYYEKREHEKKPGCCAREIGSPHAEEKASLSLLQ